MAAEFGVERLSKKVSVGPLPLRLGESPSEWRSGHQLIVTRNALVTAFVE